MSKKLGGHNYGCVVRVVADGQVCGMICIGGNSPKINHEIQTASISASLKFGKISKKSELINTLGLRVLYSYYERQAPDADLDEISERVHFDVKAVSGLLGTKFWMMTFVAAENKIIFTDISKSYYFDQCLVFDREMLKENPFEAVMPLAA